MLQCTWGCTYLFELMFLFPSEKYPEVELWDHRVALFSIFWGDSTLLTIEAAALIYIPSAGALVLPFLRPRQHLSILVLLMAILTGVRWHFLVVLICIFWTGSDIEHLFMYLLLISVSSWVEYVNRHFSNFLIRFLLLLSCMRSVCILYADSLSYVWFTDIFSGLGGCLFILLTTSFTVCNKHLNK